MWCAPDPGVIHIMNFRVVSMWFTWGPSAFHIGSHHVHHIRSLCENFCSAYVLSDLCRNYYMDILMSSFLTAPNWHVSEAGAEPECTQLWTWGCSALDLRTQIWTWGCSAFNLSVLSLDLRTQLWTWGHSALDLRSQPLNLRMLRPGPEGSALNLRSQLWTWACPNLDLRTLRSGSEGSALHLRSQLWTWVCSVLTWGLSPESECTLLELAWWVRRQNCKGLSSTCCALYT